MIWSFVLLTRCTMLIDLWMLNHPCIPEMNSTLSWYIILLMYCWIKVPNDLLKILQLCLSGILIWNFLFCNLLHAFLFNVGLIVWKCSFLLLLFIYLNNLRRIFLKHLVEFTWESHLDLDLSCWHILFFQSVSLKTNSCGNLTFLSCNRICSIILLFKICSLLFRLIKRDLNFITMLWNVQSVWEIWKVGWGSNGRIMWYTQGYLIFHEFA